MLPFGGWRGMPWFGLLWDRDSMEGWRGRWFEPIGWCGVSLRSFAMATELLLIKLLAIAVTVFDLVILIDGVVRDDFAFV